MGTRHAPLIASALFLAACGSSTSGVLPSPAEGGVTACGLTTTFNLVPAADSTASYCVAAPQWVAILDTSAAELLTSAECTMRCEQCEQAACTNMMPMPEEVPSAGLSTTWDGTYYAGGTCGASVSCVRAQCAPAGRYTARACVFPMPSADGGGGCTEPRDRNFLCGDVSFALPSADPVVFPLP